MKCSADAHGSRWRPARSRPGDSCVVGPNRCAPRRGRYSLPAAILVPWIAWSTCAAEVGAANAARASTEPIAYTREGADTCIKCHDEDNEYPVLPIFKTRHATVADARTPFAGLQCEACHGPGAEHARKERHGEARAHILNFGRRSTDPPGEQNRSCLQCHENHARIGWHGSPHQRGALACASCHRIHVERDPALQAADQPRLCFECHARQRADFQRASAHPLRFGEMNCTGCHDPHDSLGPRLLRRASLNETCYDCHAEKRGPFLWEHAPAVEDCALCHAAHGSNHPALLRKRPPLLCQQCHSQAGHPSLALSGTGLPGGANAGAQPFLLAKACLNCHAQIHGSNHPSGVKLMR